EIRHTLFDPRDVEYSSQQDDFCMEIMLQMARYIFKKDPRRYIFLDGRTFSRPYQLERVLGFTRKVAQPWSILECRCSDETAKQRLDPDNCQRGHHMAENRNYELYLRVKERYEEIIAPKTVIDTDRPLQQSLHVALEAVTSGS